MIKIKEAILEGILKLNNNNIEDSAIVCKEILAYTLRKDKQYLIINANEQLTKQQIETFSNYIQEIIQGKPLQYITHNQQFMHANFYVDENVLIPQPDTEIIVENVIKICKDKWNDTNNTSKKNIKILDLCTGSGAIAISLELELEKIRTEIIASDISQEALEIAKRNNSLNKTNITFIKSDLFECIKQKDFDIIVSNPPYIKTETIKTLSKQVQNEPILALDGGKDGLEIYKKIIQEAHKYIKDNGYLCLEIGYDQKEQICNLVRKYNCYETPTVIKDFSGNDRCILIKKKKCSVTIDVKQNK